MIFRIILTIFRFSILSETLKLTGPKIQSSTELSTSDMVEDILTAQGSFNRLTSVPKFRKYSNISALPDPDVRVLQVLKSLDQLPAFKENLHGRLDEQSKIKLGNLLQSYNISI